jgi:hypothetical protein
VRVEGLQEGPKDTLAKPRVETGQIMQIRPQLIPLIRAAGAIYVAGATFAVTQDLDSQDFERCKTIAPDQARLDCLKKLLPSALSMHRPKTLLQCGRSSA